MKTALFTLSVLLLSILHANAIITVLDYYRMGDADPGAVAANPCNSATVDSIGGKNLTKGNSPTYSSDVCLPTVGGTPNHMSIAFTGSPQDYFLLNTPLSTATTNFVLEAFVKAVDSTSSARLVYNGSQFSSVNGFGFLDVNGVYEAAIGNGGSSLTTFGSASATTGWIHLALVRDGSTATFYVNGVANATSSVAPTTPTGSFTIGTTGKIAGIDEVRFSTFSSGAFQASDLLYSVPEPSIFAFFIFGTSLLLLRRRQ